MIAGEGGAAAKAALCLHGALLPSLPKRLGVKQGWGELVVCRETLPRLAPHPQDSLLSWGLLGPLRASPAIPSCLALVGPSSAPRSLS